MSSTSKYTPIQIPLTISTTTTLPLRHYHLFFTPWQKASLPAYKQAGKLLPLRVHSPHITRMIFKNHKSGHILSCSNLSITFSLKPRVLTEACLVLHDLALASSSTTSPPWSPHQITAQTHQYFYCS